jgi:hypothetical protein
MTGIPAPDDADLEAPLEKPSARKAAAEDESRRQWRNWLCALLSLAAGCSVLLYAAVVLIDPFSTGRFSLTQRIDFTTSNSRLANAGLVRDLQFDGAILGDSTAFALDPVRIAGTSKWRIAQLAIPAATPANILTVARAFERHHGALSTLEVFILSMYWCSTTRPNKNAYGPFPDWLYESTDRIYLSRIFFDDAVKGATVRVGIWLGLANQAARADGYAPVLPARNLESLLAARPADGPPPDAPFPAIDVLAAHIAALPANSTVAFVFAPPYVNALPIDGSIAAARLRACKERVQQIAAGRANTRYLDLMTENTITLAIDHYQDRVHYNSAGAHLIEPKIARLIEENGVSPK